MGRALPAWRLTGTGPTRHLRPGNAAGRSSVAPPSLSGRARDGGCVKRTIRWEVELMGEHVHAHQLANARTTIERLEAALEAAAPSDPLLEHVAHTLQTARRLAEAAVGSTPTDGDGSRGKPGSRPPSGRDRRLARAETALRRRLEDACKGFETALDKIDSPPDPRKADDEPREVRWPKVRCHRRGCDRRGKGAPSVVVDEVGVVPVWWCPSCGGEYPNHPVPRSES